jgi:rubrerythrin
MNKVETINGIRLDLEKEQDAISTYTSQASKTKDKRVKKVLLDIADEERVHVGELTKLLSILDDECKYMHEGMEEVTKTLKLPVDRETKHRRKHSKVKGWNTAYKSLSSVR